MGEGTGAGGGLLARSQRIKDFSLVEFCTSLEAKRRRWKTQRDEIQHIT